MLLFILLLSYVQNNFLLINFKHRVPLCIHWIGLDNIVQGSQCPHESVLLFFWNTPSYCFFNLCKWAISIRTFYQETDIWKLVKVAFWIPLRNNKKFSKSKIFLICKSICWETVCVLYSAFFYSSKYDSFYHFKTFLWNALKCNGTYSKVIFDFLSTRKQGWRLLSYQLWKVVEPCWELHLF